ncbi:MAG: hypothetical protein ACI9U5_000328 [Colwellia sp.]|jgi:hypothetical protein
MKDYFAMATTAKHDGKQAIEDKHSVPIQY